MKPRKSILIHPKTLIYILLNNDITISFKNQDIEVHKP